MKTTTIRLPAGRWCSEVLVGVELAGGVDPGVVELELDAGEFELDAGPPPPQPLANAASTAIVTLTRIGSSLDEDHWQPLSLVQSTLLRRFMIRDRRTAVRVQLRLRAARAGRTQ
jgi:hypothetical protein